MQRQSAGIPILPNIFPCRVMNCALSFWMSWQNMFGKWGGRANALRKYLSVLESEQPENIQAALEFAVKSEDYACVPNDFVEYGKYVLKCSGGNEALISMLDGFTNFAKLGSHFMQEDGVRQTDFGWIRRLSTPFPKQANSLEPNTLKLYMPLTGEFFEPDRWGNWQEEGNPLDGGELYVHLWNPDNWSIQTEQEYFAPNMHRGGIDLG